MPDEVKTAFVTDEVLDAMEHLSTLVRKEMCDEKWEWNDGGMEMPDFVAQAYESCNIVDDFLREHIDGA